MKLGGKMLILMASALFISLGAGIGAILYQTGTESIRAEKEHYRSQIQTVADGLRQGSMGADFEEMSDTVKNAYMRFQFRRYCGSGYALLKEDAVLENLTDYEITDTAEMEPEADFGGTPETGGLNASGEGSVTEAVQRLGKKHMLLLKKELDGLPGYEVFSAQDISGVYEQIRRQAVFAAIIYLGVLGAACLILSLLIRVALRPLRELNGAAEEISWGNLTRRAAVTTKDEIGQVGETFNKMAENVEHQVEDLKLLLGALNHEIKTPMTSIIGYADSLLHVSLNEEQKTLALRYIYSEGKRLERLSGKMLDLLGMYENDAVKQEWIPAAELFETVREIEAPGLKQKQLSLEVSAKPAERFFVDRELFETVLSNLVRNAAKASPAGGRIFLRGTREGVEVEDRGCGIPREELKQVTKAFYMVDKSRSRAEGGAGLGLALCARIAELHQAELKIESVVGKGTTVTVILPAVYKRFTV